MKLICYVFDILILFSQCYKILTNKKFNCCLQIFFFSTLTVYTYSKIFQFITGIIFCSFRVIINICITLDSY